MNILLAISIVILGYSYTNLQKKCEINEMSYRELVKKINIVEYKDYRQQIIQRMISIKEPINFQDYLSIYLCTIQSARKETWEHFYTTFSITENKYEILYNKYTNLSPDDFIQLTAFIAETVVHYKKVEGTVDEKKISLFFESILFGLKHKELVALIAELKSGITTHNVFEYHRFYSQLKGNISFMKTHVEPMYSYIKEIYDEYLFDEEMSKILK